MGANPAAGRRRSGGVEYSGPGRCAIARPPTATRGSRMVESGNGADLPEERRKEVFRALVEEQDRELGVGRARRTVAARFGLTEAQVRRIEQEGLDGEWPPL